MTRKNRSPEENARRAKIRELLLSSNIRVLPQNTYMSVASDSIALESTYARHLHEEIERNGMMPCGDYLYEGLTQFPVYQADQLIYKIQLPVQRSNGRSAL